MAKTKKPTKPKMGSEKSTHAKLKIGVLVGSLRRESWNLKIAKALIEIEPSTLDLDLVDISQLALYNEDLEEKPPKAWTEFREVIRGVDGLIFVTPEYNRSIPGVLKNAIDVGSRPGGKSVWGGKPAGIISATPYGLGAFGANHHTRQALVFLDVPTMQTPEVYISKAGELFNKNGKLINPKTEELLRDFLSKFSKWVVRNKS